MEYFVRHMVVVFVLAALIGMASESAIAEENLIQNGTFENDNDANQWPDGWGSAKAGYAWLAEEGNHFIRLKAQQPDKITLLYRTYPVPANAKALKVSARIRVSELKRGSKGWFDARFMLNFKDQAGKRLGNAAPIIANKNTGGWVEKSGDFLLPEGTALLEFMPALFRVKQGTMDLDDIVVAVVPPEPILARIKEKEEKRMAEIARRAALVKPQVPVPAAEKLPPELHVEGNRIKNTAGEEVWLQGVAVASLEWSAGGDNILKSIGIAIRDWKANCIRLGIREHFYAGVGPWQKDGGAGYRQLIEDAVNLCAANGVYIVLDLHRFRAPEQKHADFWTRIATKYKNHPAVLFELFNEPHDISWEVWRNGGFVSEKKTNEAVAAENKDTLKGFESVGMQKLVDAVRTTEAKNILIAGGIDWSYDVSGVLNGYALDDKSGNGIVYSSHVYPWKDQWQKYFLDVAEKHPLFIGEIGCQVKAMPWEKKAKDPHVWAPDALGMVQKYRLNWTAWCFHPKSSPCVLQDWEYTPTPYWGAYVKEALSGKNFEMKKMR